MGVAFVSGSELRATGGSLRTYNSYICGNMGAWTERNRDEAERRKAFESSEFYWQESGWVSCSATHTCCLPLIKGKMTQSRAKSPGDIAESHGELFSGLEAQLQHSQFFFLVILEFLRTSDPRASKLSPFEQERGQWLSYACLTTAFWMCVERKLFSLVSHLHLKSCAQDYICTWPWFR